MKRSGSRQSFCWGSCRFSGRPPDQRSGELLQLNRCASRSTYPSGRWTSPTRDASSTAIPLPLGRKSTGRQQAASRSRGSNATRLGAAEHEWGGEHEKKEVDDPDSSMVGAKLFFEHPEYYIPGTGAPIRRVRLNRMDACVWTGRRGGSRPMGSLAPGK